MTVVFTEDFSYANLAALQAGGWVLYQGSEDAIEFTQGTGEVTIALPGIEPTVHYATPSWDDYGFNKTVTGLTPGAAYEVRITGERSAIEGTVAGALVNTSAVDFAGAVNTPEVLTITKLADDAGHIVLHLGTRYSPGSGIFEGPRSYTYSLVEIEDGVVPPQFTSDLPVRGIDWDQIAYTAGVITLGGSVFGLTRGALRFDPGETFEALPFDGDVIAPVGVHEMTAQHPRFIGSFLPVGPRHLASYLPASTQATSGDTTTVTPIVPGTVLTSGDYSQNVAVTWPYLSGGTITVTFPYAFWQRYEFQPENKGELLVPCEILGVPLTAATAPYYITVVEPGTFS